MGEFCERLTIPGARERHQAAENHLHVSNVVGARIGIGLRELPAMRGCHSAVCVLWRPGASYTRFAEHVSGADGCLGRVRLQQEHDDWTRLRVLQLLMVEDVAAVADAGGSHSTEATAAPSDAGRLSTIEEISEETDISVESAGSYLRHSNEAMQLVLAAVEEDFTSGGTRGRASAIQ